MQHLRSPMHSSEPEQGSLYSSIVSIGPLHYGQKQLNPMQQKKLQYFSSFRVRYGEATYGEAALKEYKDYLASQEEAIRKCYAVKFPHITEKKFVDMMLLDAVFIMELLLRNQEENESKYKDDSILKQTWLNNSIKRDLLLLENQIPFFILEVLYKIVPDKKHQEFIELAANCFDCFYPYKRDSLSSWLELLKKEETEKEKIALLHFTDLIRGIFLLGWSQSPSERKEPENIVLMTATKLKEAGVSFEKVSFEKVIHRSLVDIKFKVSSLSWLLCLECIPKFKYFKNRLQIPQLKVDDTTECILRNLIAFEQCHYADRPVICDYVSFIDSLIHTKDDVELLVEKQVIIHELGSDEEVSTLVNGLCKQVVTNRACYKKVIKNLNEHYKNPWNHTMAALRLVYFRDAWRASSTVVGIAVLMFTLYNFFRGLLDPKTLEY